MVLGIEIGGTKLQVVQGDREGRIVVRYRYEVIPEKGAKGILSQIEEAFSFLTLKEIQGVGIGFGGPVDPEKGQVVCSHQIQGWDGFDLCAWVTERTHVPAGIENDANAAALAEAIVGAGQNANPVFYITLGSGIGGGLVCNRKIYRGMPPGEAEVGHIRLNKEGKTLESACSGWAVDRRVAACSKSHPDSSLGVLTRQSPERPARHLAAALREKDPTALGIRDEIVSDLAFGLSHVSHLFHPQIIVIGGGLSKLGPLLLEPLRDALPEWLMKAHRPGPELVFSTLGEDAVPSGALLIAAQQLKKDFL